MLHLLGMFVIALTVSTPDQVAPPAKSNDIVLEPATADVERIYEELLTLPARERTKVLVRMSPTIQSSVWKHHFVDSLVRHAEFTTEQRAVIQEALTLMTPDFFAIETTDPRWSELVDLPLRRLKEKAMKTFPDRRIARELFTHPGSPDQGDEHTPEPSEDASAKEPARRMTTNATPRPDCTCNVVSDWCDFEPLGGVFDIRCKNTWCNFSSRGCGTLGLYACEGLCFIQTS